MLVAAAGIVIAVIGYQRISTSAVTGSLVGYRLVDDETASVTISVTRSDPSRPVACIVRVRATNGSETGRRELLVPPSEATTVQVTTTVKSSQPPVMADVYGCGTEVPSYLRLPDRGGSMDRCTVLPGPCIAALTAVRRTERRQPGVRPQIFPTVLLAGIRNLPDYAGTTTRGARRDDGYSSHLVDPRVT